jgi:peptidase E
MLLDVTRVTVHPHFILLLEFENGERRSFDMANYIDQKPWARLKSGNAFQAAFIENGTVAWPGNVDIDPETLYDLSVPLREQ